MMEMASLVERIARAMHGADPLGRGYRGDWKAYVPMARAAIEEMLRNPAAPAAIGLDFGPKPAATALGEIEADIKFEALPDIRLK